MKQGEHVPLQRPSQVHRTPTKPKGRFAEYRRIRKECTVDEAKQKFERIFETSRTTQTRSLNASLDSGIASDISMNTTFNSTLYSLDSSADDASGQRMGERFWEPAPSECAPQSRRKSALATPASSATAAAFSSIMARNSSGDAGLFVATQIAQCSSADSGFYENSFESSLDKFHNGLIFETSPDLRTPLSMFKKNLNANNSPLRSFFISKSPQNKINLFKSPHPTIGVHIDGSYIAGLSHPKSLLSFQNCNDEASISGVGSNNTSVLSTAETPSKNVHDDEFRVFSSTYSPTKAVYQDMMSPNRYIYSNQDFSIFEERSPLKQLSPNKYQDFQLRPVTKRPPSAIDGPPAKEARLSGGSHESKIGQMSISSACRIRTPRFSQRMREIIVGQSREQIEVLNMARRFLERHESRIPESIPLFETEEEFDCFDWDGYEVRNGRLIAKQRIIRL